jgi:cell division septum initiation protein DivIVA
VRDTSLDPRDVHYELSGRIRGTRKVLEESMSDGTDWLWADLSNFQDEARRLEDYRDALEARVAELEGLND